MLLQPAAFYPEIVPPTDRLGASPTLLLSVQQCLIISWLAYGFLGFMQWLLWQRRKSFRFPSKFAFVRQRYRQCVVQCSRMTGMQCFYHSKHVLLDRTGAVCGQAIRVLRYL